MLEAIFAGWEAGKVTGPLQDTNIIHSHMLESQRMIYFQLQTS